jgi:hypothetical protein
VGHGFNNTSKVKPAMPNVPVARTTLTTVLFVPPVLAAVPPKGAMVSGDAG